MKHEILAPVVALVAWSLVMWVWMYATRIPAMLKARIRLDPTVPPTFLMSVLPARVRWKADNYNHLMEQPTLFYALALTLAVAGAGDGFSVWVAWTYVGLRIVHSGVQALINVIALRFAVFVLSTVCLMILTAQAAMSVF